MNPYRSEFILALAESLKVLSHIGDPLPRTVATRYPEVARAIETPSPPVVLELRGISRERLLGEKGNRDIDAVKSFNQMQAYPEINFPSAYRIGLTKRTATILGVRIRLGSPKRAILCRNGSPTKRYPLAVDSRGNEA
jgi:hypothetical protein